MNMVRILKQYSMVFVYHLVFFWIVIANFPVGKYFIGWDSLNPEFNFLLNFMKPFAAFWQENYGLGALTGHGMVATLPHTFIISLMSVVLSPETLRPAFTFGCLYLGGLGMFFLSRKIVAQLTHSSLHDFHFAHEVAALGSGLFYILNLGTVQTFAIQLEAFIVQFAALPWLFIAVLLLNQQMSREHLLFFFVVNVFASIQGFIPPLFVAYMFALCLFYFVYILVHKERLMFVKKALITVGLTILINAYWFIPVGYHVLTRSSVYLNSYNNLYSTPEFVSKNKKYGDLSSVALIKGFLFEGTETDQSVSRYVFQPWVTHQENTMVRFVGYGFFALALIGLLYSIKKHFYGTIVLPFVGVFLFFFTGITTNVFPFSIITYLLQNYAPVYRQAFRAAFTKFSVGVGFSYAIFIALGVLFIFHLLSYFGKKKWLHYGVGIVLLASILYYSLPAFEGHLLYNKLVTKLPSAYVDLIDYFKNQEDGRIAEFPQDCAYGWYRQKWGYTGSGLYWQSIKQPVLSRSYDVWSKGSENYYWELTQAQHERDNGKIERILQKYDVRWILYDPNIIHCRAQKGFKESEEFINSLSTSNVFRLVKTFSSDASLPLYLYERVEKKSVSYISIVPSLANIGPEYSWTDTDGAVEKWPTYKSVSKEKHEVYYPYRSLSTKRKAEEKEFGLNVNGDSVSITESIPVDVLKSGFITIQPFYSHETVLPASLTFVSKGGNLYDAVLTYLYPEILVNGKTIFSYKPTELLGTYTVPSNKVVYLSVAGTKYELSSLVSPFYFGLNTKTENTIELSDSNENRLLRWNSGQSTLFQKVIQSGFRFSVNKSLVAEKDNYMTVRSFSPVVLDITGKNLTNRILKYSPRSCNEFEKTNRNAYFLDKENGTEYVRLQSQNSRICVVLFLNNEIIPSSHYLIELVARNMGGSKPLFYVSNSNLSHILDLFVYADDQLKSYYYVLPASNNSDIEYQFIVDNLSQNNEKTINDFGGIKLRTVPFGFASSVMIKREGAEDILTGQNNKTATEVEVKHPFDTNYQLEIQKTGIKNESNVVLWQEFDNGWKAYEVENDGLLNRYFPFIFGGELTDHVLVNNWANGWGLLGNNQLTTPNKQQNIVIIFWPQYLQFLGFGLLITTFLGIIFWPARHR